MKGSNFSALVTETQFATELVQSGIRHICSIPMRGDVHDYASSNDIIYKLNVGLHMYTSGLERLCKLAILCHGYTSTASFTAVKKYSHRLSRLLKVLEELDTSLSNSEQSEYLSRPAGQFTADLVVWLERYASGTGRYELLDSLADSQAEVLTWESWIELCSGKTVSSDIKDTIDIRHAMDLAIQDVVIANGVETISETYLADNTLLFYEPSVAVGVDMHRLARWPAAVIDYASYYTSPGLPILQEVVYVLTQESGDFFGYQIAQISDRDVAVAELENHYATFVMPESEFHEDDLFEEEQ